jgi:hypothetical protein
MLRKHMHAVCRHLLFLTPPPPAGQNEGMVEKRRSDRWQHRLRGVPAPRRPPRRDPDGGVDQGQWLLDPDCGGLHPCAAHHRWPHSDSARDSLQSQAWQPLSMLVSFQAHAWSVYLSASATAVSSLIDLCYILTSEKHRRLSRKFVETPVDIHRSTQSCSGPQDGHFLEHLRRTATRQFGCWSAMYARTAAQVMAQGVASILL